MNRTKEILPTQDDSTNCGLEVLAFNGSFWEVVEWYKVNAENFTHWMKMPPKPSLQKNPVRDYTKPIKFYCIDHPKIVYVTEPTFSHKVVVSWQRGIFEDIGGIVKYDISTCENMFLDGAWIQIQN